jgi:hypothetical protein
MARCRVSYKNDDGVHTVEVNAETLYEAVAEAVAEFREDQTISELPGLETELTVIVLRKPPEHQIKLNRVHEWAKPSTKGGPAAMLRRERVRKMLLGGAAEAITRV